LSLDLPSGDDLDLFQLRLDLAHLDLLPGPEQDPPGTLA